MSVKVENFGKLDDGTVIEQFTIKNKNGMVVQVTNDKLEIETKCHRLFNDRSSAMEQR